MRWLVETLASCAPTTSQLQTEEDAFLIALRGGMRCQIRKLGMQLNRCTIRSQSSYKDGMLQVDEDLWSLENFGGILYFRQSTLQVFFAPDGTGGFYSQRQSLQAKWWGVCETKVITVCI